MKAFIITIPHNKESIRSAQRCYDSIRDTRSLHLEAEFFQATTPNTLSKINWTWPLRKKLICPKTNLLLTAYKNVDINKRIACAESHYRLWNKCVELKRPICILEHDAIFIRQFVPFKHTFDVLSLNSPIGATFKGNEYDNALDEGESPVPYIADKNIPQGLPGHSAYIITPKGAKKAIELQDTIGWWPNDAIMCKQLMSNIGCVKPYYTELQNTKSSTSN